MLSGGEGTTGYRTHSHGAPSGDTFASYVTHSSRAKSLPWGIGNRESGIEKVFQSSRTRGRGRVALAGSAGVGSVFFFLMLGGDLSLRCFCPRAKLQTLSLLTNFLGRITDALLRLLLRSHSSSFHLFGCTESKGQASSKVWAAAAELATAICPVPSLYVSSK